MSFPASPRFPAGVYWQRRGPPLKPGQPSMADDTPRKLHRSRTHRVLFGVTGGVADYLDVDVTLVRVGFIVLTLVNGLGLLIYITLAVFMPESPGTAAGDHRPVIEGGRLDSERTARRARYCTGGILIIAGAILFFRQFGVFWWFGWDVFLPTILILLGVALIARKPR